MSSATQGFAIRRNGSCLAGLETDCGQTVAPFRGCCPTGFECPSQYNIACCDLGRNCTQEIIPEPNCSNATWDLFDNGGYFCCEHGLPGYNRGGSNGCASPGYKFKGGEEILGTVKAGQSSTSSTTSEPPSLASTSSSDSSATPPPTDSPSSQESSSSNTGAIAGGVVGGVAGLALIVLLVWFILRRKRKNPYDGTQHAHVEAEDKRRYELETPASAPVELGTKEHWARELHTQEAPVELPATTSQATTSKDTTSQDTTSQATTSKDTTSQATTSKDTTSQDKP